MGAILYSDPVDYAPFGASPDQVYDQKWFMPPSGTQRGSAFTSNGDPLTPVYPSTGLKEYQLFNTKLSMFPYYRLYVQSE